MIATPISTSHMPNHPELCLSSSLLRLLFSLTPVEPPKLSEPPDLPVPPDPPPPSQLPTIVFGNPFTHLRPVLSGISPNTSPAKQTLEFPGRPTHVHKGSSLLFADKFARRGSLRSSAQTSHASPLLLGKIGMGHQLVFMGLCGPCKKYEQEAQFPLSHFGSDFFSMNKLFHQLSSLLKKRSILSSFSRERSFSLSSVCKHKKFPSCHFSLNCGSCSDSISEKNFNTLIDLSSCIAVFMGPKNVTEFVSMKPGCGD